MKKIVLAILILTLFLPSLLLRAQIPDVLNAIKVNSEVGYQAPELTLKTAKGYPISLFTLRGKIVLVYFWSSWNPKSVKKLKKLIYYYDQYQKDVADVSKGFEIYSISLDTKMKRWTDAIKENNLITGHHVSDLVGYNSITCKLYNLPPHLAYYYLLDPNGIIVAKGGQTDDFGGQFQKLISDMKKKDSSGEEK